MIIIGKEKHVFFDYKKQLNIIKLFYKKLIKNLVKINYIISINSSIIK